MSHRLIDVPPEHIDNVRPLVTDWIEEAAQSSAYFTSADVWQAIAERRAQLWLAWDETADAVCVTQLENTSKGKHCHIWIMTGRTMDAWHPLMNDLEAWAKREGCNMMRHEARPGGQGFSSNTGMECPMLF